jgi:hypothetical protein
MWNIILAFVFCEAQPVSVTWTTITQHDDPHVHEILSTIGELGFVETHHMKVVLPVMNLYTNDRMPIMLQFISDYLFGHPEAELNCFYSVYDGWREHTPPATSLEPTFALLEQVELQAKFVGHGTIGEPGRFIKPYPEVDVDLYPAFQYPVIAFSRHKNDPTVILLPDPEFIATRGHMGLKEEVDVNDIPWEQKRDRMVWRGGNNGMAYTVYNVDGPQSVMVDAQGTISTRLLNQRELLVWHSQRSAFANVIDAAFAPLSGETPMTKRDMLRYKYQIDVDGEVNAWTGLIWKLYSGSTVFKVDSHYEQWYYSALKPWIHYVPIRGDLKDLDEKIAWAMANDDLARRIADNGRAFAANLTYESVIETYKIVQDYRLVPLT